MGKKTKTTVDYTLDLLGLPVRDRVTGIAGIVTSVSFDLYGCIQALVHPGLDKDGNPRETRWFDANRLQLGGDGVRVMPRPQFEGRDDMDLASYDRGPAEKPAPGAV